MVGKGKGKKWQANGRRMVGKQQGKGEKWWANKWHGKGRKWQGNSRK